MPLPRNVRWIVPPLALFALAGWIASRSEPTPPEQEGPPATPAQEAPQHHPDAHVAVAKFVAQKNGVSARDQEAFTRAGWQMVDVPPPDQRLVSVDPSLLAAGREPE